MAVQEREIEKRGEDGKEKRETHPRATRERAVERAAVGVIYDRPLKLVKTMVGQDEPSKEKTRDTKRSVCAREGKRGR